MKGSPPDWKSLKITKTLTIVALLRLEKRLIDSAAMHLLLAARASWLTRHSREKLSQVGWSLFSTWSKNEKFLLRNFDLLKPVRDETIFIADTFFVFFSRANWALLTLKRQHLRKQILHLKKASHFIFGWRHRGAEFVAGQVRIP